MAKPERDSAKHSPGIISLNVYKFNKAIPIKCFVSHRPIDPFFSKSKKKEFQIRKEVKEASNLQAHDLVLLTTIGMM